MDPTAKSVLIAATISMIVVAIAVYVGKLIYKKMHDGH